MLFRSADADQDKLVMEDDLFTDEELQEHERWAKDFASGLRKALVPDNSTVVPDQTQSTSSSNQPPPPSHGTGNDGKGAGWGANILHSLDKAQSRRKRKRENAKKAKAAKAAAKNNENPTEDSDSHHVDPEDNDGTDHVPPKKKTYKQAASEDEKPRGFALLQITATVNGGEIGRAHV